MRWSLALFVGPLAGAAIVALTVFHSGIYHALVREDSLFEWAEFAAYAAAAVFAFWTAVRLGRQSRLAVALAFGGLALCCLFAAGEEISWGQRIFGIDTPDRLERLNRQEELNVHDLRRVERGFALTLIAASLYGVLAPLLSRKPRLWVPPVFLSSAFLVTFAYVSGRLLFFPQPEYDLAKSSEWPELCFAGAFAVFAWLGWRRARPAQ